MSTVLKQERRSGFSKLLQARTDDFAPEPELALYRATDAYESMCRHLNEHYAGDFWPEIEEFVDALEDTLNGYRSHLHNRRDADQLAWIVKERDSVLEELEYIDNCAELVVKKHTADELGELLDDARAKTDLFRSALAIVTPVMLILEDNVQKFASSMITGERLIKLLELRNSYFATPTTANLEAYVGFLRSDPVLSGETPQSWNRGTALANSLNAAEKLHQATRVEHLSKLEVALLMHELDEDGER